MSRRSALLAPAAAVVLFVSGPSFGWSAFLDPVNAAALAVPASKAEESEAERIERCKNLFEMVSDPLCMSPWARENGVGLQEGLELLDELKDPSLCIAKASALGLNTGDAFTACAARQAAIDEHERASRAAQKESLMSPDWGSNVTEYDLSTAAGCNAYALSIGMPESDGTFACSMRLSRIAERKANEALEQIRAIREKSEREATNRQACQDIAKKVIEMSDGMYTAKWNQLGGDAEWKRLEKEFLDRNCQEVLK